MANKIMVMGGSGTGKTSAIRLLEPTSTFIIGSDKQGLPFRGWKKNYRTTLTEDGKLDITKSNYYVTSDTFLIIKLIKLIHDKCPHIKTIIVDNLTSISEKEFMDKAKDKGFEKFTDIATNIFDLITVPDNLERDDLDIIYLAHTEDKYDANGELRTSFKVIAGKLVGEKIIPESRFNTVLYTDVVQEQEGLKYYFITQNNGRNTCKSPDGMFEDLRIPNDYKYVLERVHAYEEGE